MSLIEIIAQIMLLITRGADTTHVAIVMQIAPLLQHPEQWAALVRDPA
jgi:cytochrome P450